MAYIYVFQSGQENLYKIGRTRGDVEKRRKDLSTGNRRVWVARAPRSLVEAMR